MERNLKNLFGLLPKSVPAIDNVSEVTREGIPKAFIPYFFYKPPFGYPRYTDLVTIRRLAGTPYVEMCINLILDEMSPIAWDIVPEDGVELTEEKQKEIDNIKHFFENPNTNKESFADVREQYLRDVLEINSGVINKMFNKKEEMVEIVARDGATFTKNPDIYGMYTNRDDIVSEPNIAMNKRDQSMMDVEPGWISQTDVKERAAYFQYGWSTAARPVPFGKRELVWFERRKRTDNLYARGMVEVLANTIQTFVYAIENDLEFFSDNQIPAGILGLEGSNTEELKAFREQWKEQQRVKDTDGNWKKKMHNIPIMGKTPKFESLQFTSQEMELIEKQKWWAKMVWACFGVTGSELGYTEDAKGMANQIVQSSSFKRRTIYPLLRLEEYKINHEIISEFYKSEKKKEVTKAILKGINPDDAEKQVNDLEAQKKLPYQGLKFKFLVFDVEEETKKANLFKLQIESGYKTVNEIRKQEGMEEVDWGNDNPKQPGGFGNLGNNNWGNPWGNEYGKKKEESQPIGRTDQEKKSSISYEEESEIIKENKKKPEAKEKHKFKAAEWTHPNGHPRCLICGQEESITDYCNDTQENYNKVPPIIIDSKDIEMKPFGKYADFDACVRANSDKGNPQAYCAALHKKITGEWPGEKAMMTIENPLILRENEVPTEDRLRRGIVYLMKENEKKIKDLIEKEIGRNTLHEIKSVEDIAKQIKNVITFEGLKILSDAVIKNEFMKGWEDSEKKMQRNILVNKEAINFIQDYTFNNIKSMTDEILTDLRQELERGIMNGEGIFKLKERITKVFDVGENRAEMIARTESNRAENQGKFIAIKNSGEKYKKRWSAVHDDRTSEICKELDGQEVELEDNFHGKGFDGPCPPAHVDCRSSLLFIRKED